ncbi:MAG: VC0807 family protein [Clostridium perfringens]|nr:VC0807 family protein [Clostridium perfringens]
MESKKEIIKSLIKMVLPSVLINSILPLVLYEFFMLYFSSLDALIIAITVPIFYNIYEVLKEKKVDAFGILMLASFGMGIGCVFLGGGEKFLLLKESFVTFILGFTFLITLLLKKPLVYYFILKFEPDRETFNETTLKELWKKDYFKFSIKFMNLIWGIAMLLDATLKTILVFHVSVSVFLVASNLITYSVVGLTILWTIHYRNRLRTTVKNSINENLCLKHT